MKKKLIAVVALIVILGTGAYAQLALGFTGSIYSDTNLSASQAATEFRHGENTFYGPLVEIGLGHLAIGASGNFSFYQEDWSLTQNGSYYVQMVDYDINIYLQGHLFGYKAFFDPFLEAGGGVMGKNFQDSSMGDNPILLSRYLDLGAGLGLNFGGLGIFAKVNYVFPGSPVQKTVTVYYPNGAPWYTTTTNQPMYDVKNFKFTIGAKLIL